MVNKGLKANDLVQRAEALIDIEMLECPSQDARYQEIIRIMAEAAPSFHSDSPSKEPLL
ncbi:hypothetical protein FA13DRAFT_1807352 [Coprinellus micaceus]|uniref:Uncharacterized protein n=1 Tax=Coprinellus micaceus TaxID=71717 RepID=A0A4Y7R941_COPMI|nr:hypothetical protein FA13DRAFT_1807352 [Coprinellus micaceus]